MPRRAIPFLVLALSLALAGAAGRARADAEPAPTPAPAAAAQGCVSGDCHKDMATDAKHKQKGVTCVKCHSSVTDGSQDHSDTLDVMPPKKMCGQAGCHTETATKLAAGAHKESMCEGCHGESHGKFLRTDWSACKGCHGDQVAALDASIHRTTSVKNPVECIDCHGDLHEPKLKGDATSPMSKVLQVQTCSECHDNEHTRAFRTSVHGQGLLRSGLAVAPSCTDCHGNHDIRKVKDPAAKVSKLNTVETCGKCHQFIVARWKNSTHGEKWLEQRDPAAAAAMPHAEPMAPASERPKQGPVCIDCHSGHYTFDPMIYGNNLKMADRCGECHEESSRTYRESFHGKATRLGMRAAATCADCHTPHEMLPKSDPRSSVNPANLAKTCGRCHQNASAQFLTFDVHANPANPHRDARIYWIYRFMTGLLFCVIGFFSIHALLWLQRSIVALRRKELHHERKPGEPWVRRFRPLHMGIHVAIVTTFLVLSATGLPIKFSGVGWAHAIETVLGGPEITRWLHRIAGIVTFGYAIVYVGYLLREVVVNKRTGLFWGWQSMMPNKKDFQDLFANIRWFLYLGKPPRLDRWAYWEKFDFFAVFWGIPVIGLSGLLLWAPVFFTSFLPGWVLNAAYVIHSDEALLATGFIFFFHFFHTHLRPESFPLDPVVFLGGMPLSRFQHERPAEYERAVAAGKLESLLMPPPSERATRRALRFGFVALAIGVVLGLLLLATGVRAVLH